MWVTSEAALDGVLAPLPPAVLCAFGSPTRPADRPARTELEAFVPFRFNDIAEPRAGLVAPDAADIARLLAVVVETRGPIVLQCWFGISRSTAAALAVACAIVPVPERHARRLRALAPEATPNPLVVRLADDALALDGRLVRAVERIGRGRQADAGRPFRLPLRDAP